MKNPASPRPAAKQLSRCGPAINFTWLSIPPHPPILNRNSGAIRTRTTPDIGVQVFAHISEDVGGLRDPIVVMASQNDELLSLSSMINQSATRFGAVIPQHALTASSKATLKDARFAAHIWSSNHMIAFRSSEVTGYLNAFETTTPEAR